MQVFKISSFQRVSTFLNVLSVSKYDMIFINKSLCCKNIDHNMKTSNLSDQKKKKKKKSLQVTVTYIGPFSGFVEPSMIVK